MPKLPDWHCSKCNFTIFGSKQFCGKCGEKNPNWDRSTTEASKPSAAADSNTTTTMKNGREKLPDWFCEPCQFWVFGSKRTCRCGKENPNWPSSSGNNSNNKSEQQPAAASTSSSAPAPVAPAPASQQQQQQQPEQQQQQRQQRGGRGGGGGGRAPDFHCPNCKFNVYGSKPACGKCGYPNPAW